MPIFCTRLTAGLIKLKLEEHGLVKSTRLTTVSAGDTVRAGKFNVEFIHVNHSIADSVSFAIHTHLGTIVHTGDFKIDSTPIDGEVIDLARFGELGKEGVLALMADSTNVERAGYTQSESVVGRTFMRQFQNCDERIIVTTFASNVHRIQQVLDAAAACGRKVSVTGRSMDSSLWLTAAEEAIDREFHGTYDIWGGDIDPDAVELSRHNAKLAGVDDCVRFEVADAGKFHRDSEYGQLVSNPPYGERLMEREEAEELYRIFGAATRSLPPKWRMLILSSHTEFERSFGRTADKKRKLYNGMIKCDVFMYGK